MISLTVVIKVRAGADERFLTTMGRNRAGALADEPGCMRFDVDRTRDSRVFVVHEHYEDEAALEAHRASVHFRSWADASPSILEADGRRAYIGEPVAWPASAEVTGTAQGAGR